MLKNIKTFNQSDCKLTMTPFDANCKLKKNTRDLICQLEYSQRIGSIIYLMNSTMPDIAYLITKT